VVRNVRQKYIHTAEPLVRECSLFEVETVIANLKKYKTPGTDNIPSELLKAEGEILYIEIHILNCYIWNKAELPQKWKKSVIIQFIKNVIRLIVIIIK
jgi:hypothetical protein